MQVQYALWAHHVHSSVRLSSCLQPSNKSESSLEGWVFLLDRSAVVLILSKYTLFRLVTSTTYFTYLIPTFASNFLAVVRYHKNRVIQEEIFTDHFLSSEHSLQKCMVHTSLLVLIVTYFYSCINYKFSCWICSANEIWVSEVKIMGVEEKRAWRAG